MSEDKHKIGVDGEKSYSELLVEIRQKNPSISTEKLDSAFTKIKENYSSIADKDRNDIRFWAKQVQLKLEDCNQSNQIRIAYVWRAMELFSGCKMRTIQVLSVILFYHLNAGRLAQIGTGEGKTFIIAMIAALFALDGRKVDIGEFRN